MFFRRALFVCCLCFFAWQTAFAQGNSPAPVTEPAHPIATPASPQITFDSVHVDGPYIAMTFDDGPSAALTPRLLDILAAHHMHVTFFVIGQNAADHPDILKRAVREGHEIENHSWSHPNLGKMGDDAVRRELQKTDDVIKAAIGTRPTLFRPPYGSITARQKSWIHQEFGYRVIIWDVDPLDWKRPGPSVVTRRILSETRAGSIILSHDIHPGTIEAMPATFDQLKEKGFKFVTVTELIAMQRPPTPKPSPSARPAASETPAPVAPNE